MPSQFHGIHTLSSALRTFQRSLDVTGQNIANVNTRGYARQRVELKSLPSIDFYSGQWRQLGSGVTISAISSARDTILDGQMGSALSRSSKNATLADGLKQIDAIYGEPSDTGLSAGLGRLFDAWSNLAANPAEPAWKREVQEAGAQAAGQFNQLAEGLTVQSQITAEAMKLGVARLNQLADEVARLNGEIRQAQAVGGSPNELINSRQAALEEMASVGGVSWRSDAYGMVTVYSGPNVVLQGESAQQFEFDGSQFSVAGRPLASMGGELGGLKDLSQRLDGQMGQLDRLANELRDRMNGLHATGPQGNSFFDPNADGAVGLRLSAEVAADPAAIDAGTEDKTGDGSLAQALADLREQNLAGLNGRTLEGYYREAVIDLAAQAESAQAQADIAEAQTAQIENRRSETMGVNLDEEMAEMVKLQRTYQAAARALSTMDQITEELLGIVR